MHKWSKENEKNVGMIFYMLINKLRSKGLIIDFWSAIRKMR